MSATFIVTIAEAYVGQAVAELRILDQRIGNMRSLAPGVIRLDSSLDRAAFLDRLTSREPVFVRHVQPVDAVVELDGTTGDLERIRDAVIYWVSPGERVAVHVRRFRGELPYSRYAVKEALDPGLAGQGAEPVTEAADRIISIALDEGTAYIGLSTPAENLSDWPGGEVRLKREDSQVSRAKFKLQEALWKFEVQPAPGGHALDLGAAPGGWTSLLLEHGMRVTAVDTGELAPDLLGVNGLTFLQKNVADVSFPPHAFDLITCDMSWNPLHTANLVARLAPSVRPGAPGILTVKLMLKNPMRTIRTVADALAETYEVRKVKQLFHNRDEVTMYLIRRER